MGYHLTPEELADAFNKFKTLCDRKKDVSDRDIEALLDKPHKRNTGRVYAGKLSGVRGQ